MTNNIEKPTPSTSLEVIAQEFVREQRRQRRWALFFRFVYLVIIVSILAIILPDHSTDAYKKGAPHVAMIDVKGPIFSSSLANTRNIDEALDDAFANKNSVAVILNINSPGGSPVQASNIYNHIMYLRKKYPNKKIYAVCSDICASGAYYVASAADDIYSNPVSLVGSIGVIMESFGFTDSLTKLGMTRRVYTAGQNKDFMDPFFPVQDKDVQHANEMLAIVHQQFINDVKQGRGNRLKDNPDLFTGQIWTGQTALQLGLIDGFGDVDSVARDIAKNSTIVDYTVKPNMLDLFADNIGASTGSTIARDLGLEYNNTQLR